jgi:hypothetical protein
MFHVKHILVLATFLYFGSVKAQGSISMSTNVVNYNLPEDIGLRKTLSAAPNFNTLSKDEKDVLYYLDYARKNPSIFLDRAINVFIAGHPEINSSYIKSLQELFKTLPQRDIILPDSLLGTVSKSHARDLESHQTISHTSSNGTTFQQRVGPYLKNCGSEAIHASPRFTPLEAILMLLFDFNVPDMGHRKALLNVNFTKAGFGVALSSKGNSILVMDFSCQ